MVERPNRSINYTKATTEYDVVVFIMKDFRGINE